MCVGGKRKPSMVDEADCVYVQNKRWQVECKIRTRPCYYTEVCDTLDDCYNKHVYNNIYCCQYVCRGMIREIGSGSYNYRKINEEKVCVGGKRIPSPHDVAYCMYMVNKNWKVECKIRTRPCYYIKVCDTLDDCYKKHVYNNIDCCQYVCRNRSR